MKNLWTVILIIIGVIIITLSIFIDGWLIVGGCDVVVAYVTKTIMLIIGIVIVSITIAIIIFRSERFKRKGFIGKGVRYEKRSSIMTNPEKDLYYLLCEILDNKKYLVIPQPALNAVIEKRGGSGYYSELFRLSDFLIVKNGSFEPLLLIELNDASHSKKDRQERDNKVKAICENARIALFVIDFKDREDIGYLKTKIRKYL